jgi:2'-5' RNA ligase
MRLFFATFPDVDARRRISAEARSLDLPRHSAPMPPENYHMTLLFLGEVADRNVQSVREVGGAQIAGRIPLQFDHWEYWSGGRAVVAATSDRPESLLQLRASLAAGLRRLDIDFDDKPLCPHITVARKIAQAPVLPAMSEFRWSASAFSLVASVTGPTGSVYTVLDTWQLLDIAARG